MLIRGQPVFVYLSKHLISKARDQGNNINLLYVWPKSHLGASSSSQIMYPHMICCKDKQQNKCMDIKSIQCDVYGFASVVSSVSYIS